MSTTLSLILRGIGAAAIWRQEVAGSISVVWAKLVCAQTMR